MNAGLLPPPGVHIMAEVFMSWTGTRSFEGDWQESRQVAIRLRSQ